MDYKKTFEVAKKSGELYDEYSELMEQTDNIELKKVLKKVTEHLSDSHSKLLCLGKYMDEEMAVEKEAVNIVAYGDLEPHTKLTVVYEYENGYVLAFDTAWSEYFLPRKLLRYQ